MKREDIVAGKPFNYTGPLKKMREIGPLHFSNNTLLDQNSRMFCKASLSFSNYFFIEHPADGMQIIYLGQCQLISNS